MLSDAWAQVRSYPSRLVAVLVAVALGVGFLTATSVFTATSAEGLRLTAAAPLTRADIYLEADPSVAGEGRNTSGVPAWLAATARDENVASVDPVYARTIDVFGAAQRGLGNVLSLPGNPAVRWFTLSAGRWPAGPRDVVTDEQTLSALGVSMGSRLQVRTHREERDGERPKDLETVTITGVADLGFQPLTGVDFRFYADQRFFGDDVTTTALATVRDEGRLTGTIDRLNATLPDGVEAATASSAADAAASRFVGGGNSLMFIMLGFALIAVLSAGIVIANTFTVLLTQRRRQTALLRLMGAHRSQVRTLILLESLIIGAMGSVLGLALGVGLGYLGARWQGLDGGGLVVNPFMLVLCLLAGIACTVAAAWLPARRATEVPPAAAWRTAAVSEQGAPSSRTLPRVALAVLVLGLAVAGVGAPAGNIAMVVFGGFLSAIGLLLVLRRLVTWMLPTLERVLGRMGVSAQVAGANLRRHPERTGSAAVALVIGTSLIVALMVGARSGQASVDADLKNRYPVDVSLRTSDTALSPGTVAGIHGLPDLTVAAVLPEAPARFPASPRERISAVLGAPADVLRAAGAEQLLRPRADASPGLLVSPQYLAAARLKDGSSVTAVVAGQRRSFTVHPSPLPSLAGPGLAVLHADTLAGLGVPTTTRTIWAVAGADADREAWRSAVGRVAALDPSITVSGGLSERGDIANILSILVNLSIAMLLVTVLIAVVGLANILRLSVVERTVEIALLRALGTRRGMIRAMLATEALGIGVIGALLGLVIGIPYGLLGVAAVVGRQATLVVDLPWTGMLGGILLISLCGVLAGILPGWQASRIPPAEGLTAQ